MQQLQKRVQNPEPPDCAGFQHCFLLPVMCLQTYGSPQLHKGIPMIPVAVKALQGTSPGSWHSENSHQVLVSEAEWIISNTCLLEDVFQVCEQKRPFLITQKLIFFVKPQQNVVKVQLVAFGVHIISNLHITIYFVLICLWFHILYLQAKYNVK